MNIALVITGLAKAGAERQVCDLADQFIGMGHKVMLISLSGEAVQKPASDQVKIQCLNLQVSWLDFLPAYFKLRKQLQKFEPDVVHSHLIHANLFARLLRITTDFPKLISTAHNIRIGGRFSALAYRLTDRLADLSTNVSKEAVQSFLHAGATRAGRMVVMHNGINIDNFSYRPELRISIRKDLGIEENTPLLLAVGRLTEQKDYPNLFRAFKKVLRVHSAARLIIVGTGELETKLLSDIRDLDIVDKVVLLGLRDDVSGLMSAADVLVLSSAWEGFGLVVAEAMACECLVAATDCGGVKEVLGNSGWLVPPQNSDALAAALDEILMLDETEKLRLRALARTRVSDSFSIESAAQNWIKLYEA